MTCKEMKGSEDAHQEEKKKSYARWSWEWFHVQEEVTYSTSKLGPNGDATGSCCGFQGWQGGNESSPWNLSPGTSHRLGWIEGRKTRNTGTGLMVVKKTKLYSIYQNLLTNQTQTWKQWEKL